MKTTSNYSNLILLTMIPFIIGDLYFSYKDMSCTHNPITNAKISFNLDTWLKISGYTNLAFVLFPVVSFFLSACAPSLLIIYLILAGLYVFFRFAWLVVGAVMFWGFLWPNRLCSNALNTYMWINLIYSFFTLFILCYLQQQVYELRNSQTVYKRTNERTRLNI